MTCPPSRSEGQTVLMDIGYLLESRNAGHASCICAVAWGVSAQTLARSRRIFIAAAEDFLCVVEREARKHGGDDVGRTDQRVIHRQLSVGLRGFLLLPGAPDRPRSPSLDNAQSADLFHREQDLVLDPDRA